MTSGAEMNDEHVIEAIGKCRVVIRDGKVVEVGEPIIRDCPLAKRFACPIPSIDRDSIRANIEHRIASFGMCTPGRVVRETREFVGFGASEILSFGLHAELIGAVVLVCDGAGTVVVNTPALVQGIGGRMSGLVSTTPYLEVIARIEESGGVVIDPLHASIDQGAGVTCAYEKGYRNVAVTLAEPDDAAQIRDHYPDAFIFLVHSTGLTSDEAALAASSCDLVTACASRPIREIAGRVALVQAGVAIPVFALTEKGKTLIIEKVRQGKDPLLVKTTRLPAPGDQQPDPLV